jgi:hypothetical protein
MRDKKATGDYDVPANVLRLLREDGSKLMTQLINNLYETGEWLKDFIYFKMMALKKSKATKCCDHHTVSLITEDIRDSSKDT